jgi:maltose alpha-D-glucosyltransferase/alpha-amylase
MNDAVDWYKDAIIYELRVRSFYDSNDDGVGDLNGLIEKLDYLKDLGVTAIWLLPTYPSPLRDDGYDIADYSTVHRVVGTLDDFRRMLDAAHARDLKVITELVLNHTSDAHPWFQRARRAPPGSRFRNFYVWSDDPHKWADARIIFQDFETSNWTWDPVANAYYWHRFFSHQPDLNFESEDVQEAMLGVVDHWFELGVDGLRLDAVPYLYEREGTTCENLPETHAFLKKLRAHIDRKFTGRMLLAEANQWPEDAALYFGKGDECHMAFHFPIMPRLFMALRMEDSYAIADILEQTPPIPESCQWAVFLRNHDELTLEMVTDEERDYMVQRYASDRQTRINLGIRRRLAPLMENDRRSIELMNVLLLSMPGTPVIYYGDEIGMGDNAYLGDRNGVRTPMQWSPDRNGGFSRANPQRLILPTIIDPEYSYETVNVEVQQGNPRSLLWWTRRALALRKQHPAFARGTLTLLAPENRKVMAFLRRYQNEALLVVVNLSRAPQWVELALGEFVGARPVELFGNVEFPPVTEPRYLLTLGGHGVFWFSLARRDADASGAHHPAVFVPAIVTAADAGAATWFRSGSSLEATLARYVPGRRWFRSKTRKVTGARLADGVPLPAPATGVHLAFVELAFDEGDPELYVLPIALVEAHEAPASALLGVRRSAEEEPHVWLTDASQDGRVGRALHALATSEERLRGGKLELAGIRSEAQARDSSPQRDSSPPSARALSGEQSNTSYVVGQEYVGKLVRKLEEGRSLEVDVLEHLARAPSPPNVPRLLSRVAVESGAGSESTLWISQSYVQNQGDAWELTIDALQRFYERVLTTDRERTPRLPEKGLLAAASEGVPPEVEELFAEHLLLLRILGTRTAELHLALAHDRAHPSFAPRRYTALSRRSFYQSLRNSSARAFDKLGKAKLSPPLSELAEHVSRRRGEIRERIDRVLSSELGGFTIRVHGDYHLGQVLYTGRDFYIIDFEGEPSRARAERERLRSPMADVAGMLRSFHYAALGVLSGELSGSRVREEDRPALSPWATFHQRWSSIAFLSTYLAPLIASELLPSTHAELSLLLDVHLLEKALYELSYELDSRPTWVELPLQGLLDVLGV